MKILYVTTIGGTMVFFKTLISELVAQGHTVDIASNITTSPVPEFYQELGCNIYPLSCSRSPLSKSNLKTIRELRKLVKENKYDIVHCHTPVAAMCTRLACVRARKKGTKVFYTAHGFHFYKGAPKKNWLLFYPVEKVCAHFTDTLLTINKEDYAFAKKKIPVKRIEYVPGVGIDISKYENTVVDRKKKREEIGVPETAKMILSVGELNENKNHISVIRAIARLKDETIHYVIAGSGGMKETLEQCAKEKNVNLHLLGFRRDVAELYKTADLYVHPSFREGLPVALMECLASGTPAIGSNIRGTVDLLDQNVFPPTDVEKISQLILEHADNGKIDKSFSVSEINQKMKEIYGLNV